MTTLHQWQMPVKSSKSSNMKIAGGPAGAERREFRRHDLDQQGVVIERCDAQKGKRLPLGRIVDISTAGIRVRAARQVVHPDQQIRVRLELPPFAGICPFVDTTSGQPSPKREWVGWMTVSRVKSINDNQCEIAGRLMDMEEMDRGMLGLYLSTQPLAA